jgi:hypothetical protein
LTVYAEDVNYWKTGSSSADTWIDKAKAEIRAAGGGIESEAYGREGGRAAFLLDFRFGDDRFRVVWPVLPVRRAVDERAARVQAATMLYHDVKAKAVAAKVHGTRAAFFQYLALPDGRTAAQLATPELTDRYPRLLAAPSGEE